MQCSTTVQYRCIAVVCGSCEVFVHRRGGGTQPTRTILERNSMSRNGVERSDKAAGRGKRICYEMLVHGDFEEMAALAIT